MARLRNIKPGFFLNDELAEIEPLGRLLFAGLWTIADREGRVKDRPKKIKAAVLPYDDCNVDKLLQALHDKGFIIRYQVDGKGYLAINNWHKHQNPHHKEPPSEIPEPDKPQASTGQEPDKPQTCLVLTPDLPSTSRADPDPDPDPDKRSVQISKDKPDYEAEFEAWWKDYPLKKSKADARKSWVKLRKSNKTIEQLTLYRDRYIAEIKRKGTEGRYILHGSTFLNGRWEDYSKDSEPSEPPITPAPVTTSEDLISKWGLTPEQIARYANPPQRRH